jgi:hypothetical protein
LTNPLQCKRKMALPHGAAARAVLGYFQSLTATLPWLSGSSPA